MEEKLKALIIKYNRAKSKVSKDKIILEIYRVEKEIAKK